MTDRLFQRFKERFPDINGTPRVSFYGAYERIYLSLYERIFAQSKRALITPDEISKIARGVFWDVNFVFEERGDIQFGIFFEPTGVSEYSCSYDQHHIEVHQHLLFPELTISTGNRGKVVLHDLQRERYYQFACDLRKEFIRKARLARK